VAASLVLELPAGHILRGEARASVLAAGGVDGTLRIFDVRAATLKPAATHCLFPRGVVCDFDAGGYSLAASSLRQQLNPFGQQELACDPTLRSVDLRSTRRGQTNDFFFAPGAAALRWHPLSPTSLLAASPGGALQTLDARGGMTAPHELQTSVGERGAQLLSLGVASSGHLIATADSHGALCVCAPQAASPLVPSRLLLSAPLRSSPRICPPSTHAPTRASVDGGAPRQPVLAAHRGGRRGLRDCTPRLRRPGGRHAAPRAAGRDPRLRLARQAAGPPRRSQVRARGLPRVRMAAS
jgi:hypothetical protein